MELTIALDFCSFVFRREGSFLLLLFFRICYVDNFVVRRLLGRWVTLGDLFKGERWGEVPRSSMRFAIRLLFDKYLIAFLATEWKCCSGIKINNSRV